MKWNIEGFKGNGNWYKGNLHSHTVNSDGMLTPAEAVKLFRDHGYQFLCFSEHDLYTDYREEFDSPDFILLPGLEASAVLMDRENGVHRKKVHHIHGILGTEEMQREAAKPLFRHMERVKVPTYYGEWDGAAAAQSLADELAARGCITTYNHPVWSRVREEEFIHTKGIFGLEIFNYNTVNESGTGYDTAHWDIMLREGYRIHGFASDDNHNEGLFDDACGGYVMVKADALTHDQIIRALLDGNYYSSSGPEIHDWGIRDGVVYVECSPVSRINFITGGFVGGGRTVIGGETGEPLVRAEYCLTGTETYVRVECMDAEGRTAWTNALFPEKF